MQPIAQAQFAGLATMALAVTRKKAAIIPFQVVLNNSPLVPYDLSASTLWFHAQFPGTAFFIDLYSPDGGITIDDAANGLATLTISALNTAGLPAGDFQMLCELSDQITLSPQVVYELNRGTLTVKANVGTP